MFPKAAIKRHPPVLIAAIAALAFPVSARSTPGELPAAQAERAERQFREKQSSTRSLRATFIQKITIPGMRDTVVSEGELIYLAPDRLAVNFSQPPGDFLLLAGDDFWMGKAGKPPQRRAGDDRAAKPMRSILDALRGKMDDAGSGFRRETSREGGDYRVVLTATGAPHPNPESIENRIDAATLDLEEIRINLRGGTVVEYRLTGTRRDAPVRPEEFAIPGGARQ